MKINPIKWWLVGNKPRDKARSTSWEIWRMTDEQAKNTEHYLPVQGPYKSEQEAKEHQ